MAKAGYLKCCIQKLYEYIYIEKNEKYNFVECCNHIYYVLPHQIDDLKFFLMREKNDNKYYFLTEDKKMIQIYQLNQFKDKNERDNFIKQKLLEIFKSTIHQNS